MRSTLKNRPDNQSKPEGHSPDINALHATFMQTVSHELRTPLTIIQGYSELLRDRVFGDLLPQQQEAVLTIVNEAQTMRTIVDRISSLLSVQAGSMELLPVSLGQVVADVILDRWAIAAAAGVALEIDKEPDLPLIAGDSQHLYQAVDCVVENAIKFTPAGGKVKARVSWQNNWVCVAIVDNGIGISTGELARIFQEFYQVESSTTRRYGGMGLGLSVTRAVVESHGGRLEVTSEIGSGSSFLIKLPVISQDSVSEIFTRPLEKKALMIELESALDPLEVTI